MDLMAMVMEARKGASSGITVSADPKKDKDIQANDYTGDEDTGGGNDATDTPPEDTDSTDYSAGVPEVDDNSDGKETNDEVQQDGDDIPEDSTDYSAGAPEPDKDTGGEGEETPSDDQGQQDEDTGTDYSEGAPGTETEGEEGEGPPADAEQGDTGGAEGGEEAPPEEGEGVEGESGDGTDPAGEEPVADTTGADDAGLTDQKFDDANKASSKVFLLRNYIKLLRVISRFSKKLSESRKSSLLATATYSQVSQNLTETKELLYKYILHSFDAASYDLNLYNYNLFFEILQWNVEMIRKVNDIEDKTKEDRQKKK